MKTYLLSVLMMCLSFNGFSKMSVSGNLKCEKSRLKATEDLNNGKVNFLVQSGIVSTYVKGQEDFEKKYKLKYFNFGCLAPGDICIPEYNAVVAKFLDQKFGKNWRKVVRKDIKGF